MTMAALTREGLYGCGTRSISAVSQVGQTHRWRASTTTAVLSGRLGSAIPLRQHLRPSRLFFLRDTFISSLKKHRVVSPSAVVTAVGTGDKGEPEERRSPSECLDDPEVGFRSATGRYLGRKEKPVTVVIDGKLLAESAQRAGEAARKNLWPPNKHWVPFLVAPAALLLALVATRLHQLKSATVPPSVTTSISLPLEPRGPTPELKVVGVMGSLPGVGTRSAAVIAEPLQQGTPTGDHQRSGAGDEKKPQSWVNGRLARDDDTNPQMPPPRPEVPTIYGKPITELSDIDFYEQLQKEAEIEARVRQARGFPMEDETKFGLFDDEERLVMQELVESGTLDADTQKKLEDLLAQEAGNSKMHKAAQRAMRKRVRKARERSGRKSPVSDKDVKELEDAVASGMLDENVQKDVEAFLKEEREYRRELEEADKYDDADYDISEYLEEEDDPELEAIIREMVESGEYEDPIEEDDQEAEEAAASEKAGSSGRARFVEEESSGGGIASGASKGSQRGGFLDSEDKKGGGANKRVHGLRELTDKLGLTVSGGTQERNWEAALKHKNFARIGPFEFGNQNSESQPPAGLDLTASVSKEEGPSGESREFPFAEAFREATALARSAEHPEEATQSSEGAQAEGTGDLAGVQIAAVERSQVLSDGQKETQEEIEIRVVEAEEPEASRSDETEVVFSKRTVEDVGDDASSSPAAAAVDGATPSSAEASAPSDASTPSSEPAASASSSGEQYSVAGEDMTPLVELLQSKEEDEDYGLRTSWGTYEQLSPMKRRWQVWADRQSNQMRLSAAKVKTIDSKEIRFSGKEEATEGQRHLVYQVLYKGKRYALKMSKRPEDRGMQRLLVDEAANLASVQGTNVIGLQGIVCDLGGLPIYRLGRAAGPLMTSEQLAQGVKSEAVENLQSCILPDGSKALVKTILAEGSGERLPNVYGILMEYAEGADLQAQMDKAGPEHSVGVDEAWHIFRQLAIGLGELHAARLAHNNVDLSNVLLVRDDTQASGVRCCWSGLSLAKRTDNNGNVRLTPEERLGRLMRKDDYYQAPELTDESATVLYNGFKADTYSLGKAFLLLVGNEYEKQVDADSAAVRDMDTMFAMTLQPDPEERATSVEVMEFTRAKELEAIEKWREKEDARLEEMARAGLPKTAEELELEKVMNEDPNELAKAEEAAFAALVAEMRKRQEAAEAAEKSKQGRSGKQNEGGAVPAVSGKTNH